MCLAGLAAFALVGAMQYRIQELATYNGSSTEVGIAINDEGMVAAAALNVAWRWTPSHGFESFQGLSTDEDWGVVAINNSGVVLGRERSLLGPLRAFLSVPDRTTIDIGFHGPGASTMPTALSDSNVVVGNGTFPGALGPGVIYRWSPSEPARDIAPMMGLNPYADAIPVGVDREGQIAGIGQFNGNSGPCGWLWSDGSGALQFPTFPETDCQAMSKSGDVVGEIHAVQAPCWFYYHHHTFFALYGPGGSSFTPFFVNDRGLVFGVSWAGYFVWTASGGFEPVTLAKPNDWTALEPMGMNDNGQVVGIGRTTRNEYAFFLMTPIPHPLPRPSLGSGW